MTTRTDETGDIKDFRSLPVSLICVRFSAGVEVGKPTHFTIYTKGAGKAKPEVHFTAAAKGEAVRDFEIIDNHDYSYTVRYTAAQQVQSPLLFQREAA